MAFEYWIEGEPLDSILVNTTGFEYWIEGEPLVEIVGIGRTKAGSIDINVIPGGSFVYHPRTNDFSGDSSCVALYNLESGALTVDSKGTSTLTASNTPPVAEATIKKVGSHSCKFVRADNSYLRCADANLATGFPFKSNDTTKQGTVSFWVNFSALPDSTSQDILTHNSSGAGWGLKIATNGKLQMIYRYTFLGMGWDWSTQDLFTPSVDTWYHISIIIQGKGQADTYNRTTVFIAVYDESTGSTTIYTMWPYDNGGTGFGIWLSSSSTFTLGDWGGSSGGSGFSGYLDEVVVFNRCLSISDCMKIRKGTYSYPSNSSNFSSDPNCISHWCFCDPADPRNDSVGTNDLTYYWQEVSMGFISGQPGGTRSNWSNIPSTTNQYIEKANADLSATFPFKSTDTTKLMTLCMWYSPAVAASKTLNFIGKIDTNSTKGWKIAFSSGQLQVVYGKGSSSTTYSTGIYFTEAWAFYHISLRIDGVNGTIDVRVYRHKTDDVVTYTATPGVALDCSNTDNFRISNDSLDRYLTDEVVVWNRLLSDTEIDNVRNGLFSYEVYVPVAYTYAGNVNINVKPGAFYLYTNVIPILPVEYIYAGAVNVNVKPGSSYLYTNVIQPVQVNYIGNINVNVKPGSYYLCPTTYIYTGNLNVNVKPSYQFDTNIPYAFIYNGAVNVNVKPANDHIITYQPSIRIYRAGLDILYYDNIPKTFIYDATMDILYYDDIPKTFIYDAAIDVLYQTQPPALLLYDFGIDVLYYVKHRIFPLSNLKRLTSRNTGINNCRVFPYFP